jgi:hypothetical protein
MTGSDSVVASLKWYEREKMNWKTMRAQLGPGALIPFSVVLIVAIVLISVGTYITFTVGNTLAGGVSGGAGNNLATINNIANNGTNALATISTWFTILGIVFIAAVVIGLLMYAFGGRKGGAY